MKTCWVVTVPGYRPFRLIGSPMSYAEAVRSTRLIWPLAEVE